MGRQQVKKAVSAHLYLVVEQKGLQHGLKLSTAYSRMQTPDGLYFLYDQFSFYTGIFLMPLMLIIGLSC
jgi:hypothetical protein